MSTVFVVSYLLLICVVVALILAVLGLYRLVIQGDTTLDSRPFGWPLGETVVGDEVPWAKVGSPTGFTILVKEGDEQAFSVCTSVAVVAARWGYPWRAVLPGEVPAPWTEVLPTLDPDGASPDASGLLGHATLPASISPSGTAVVFHRGGRIVDAVAGLMTPADLAAYFAMAASPIGSDDMGMPDHRDELSRSELRMEAP